MRINTGKIKNWGVYFLAVLAAVFVHELGHCVVAWINGIKAIPTPAKEYITSDVTPKLDQYIALGGVAGTIAAWLAATVLFVRKPSKTNAAIFAGTLASPGLYTFLFLLKGRGHDATEFQDAQAAAGFSYSGHSLDWLFLAILIAGIILWSVKTKPSLKVIPALVAGAVATIIFIAGLQSINNAIFDPLFNPAAAAPAKTLQPAK
ncbi:MAG TPA: hypothetical protein VG738_15365 [Chitinophagaceae bacterium]|nr:hypothetical protein [Chitinophagaceae bacterium]